MSGFRPELKLGGTHAYPFPRTYFYMSGDTGSLTKKAGRNIPGSSAMFCIAADWIRSVGDEPNSQCATTSQKERVRNTGLQSRCGSLRATTSDRIMRLPYSYSPSSAIVSYETVIQAARRRRQSDKSDFFLKAADKHRKTRYNSIVRKILLDTSCHSVSAIMKGGNHVSGTKRHEGNASRQENLHGGRSRSHFGYRQNLRIYSCQRGAFQNRANQRSMHLIHERTPRHPLSKLLFYLMLRCRERNCLQLIFEHICVSLNRRTQIAEPVHGIVISLLCVFANRFVTRPYCG